MTKLPVWAMVALALAMILPAVSIGAQPEWAAMPEPHAQYHEEELSSGGLTYETISAIVPWESTLRDIKAIDPGTELATDMNFSAVSIHYAEDGAKVLIYYYKTGSEPNKYLVERVLIEGTEEWGEHHERYSD